jgi:hypothetical protein
VPYTIGDFNVGDRVQWKRWSIESGTMTIRSGTVKEVGKAKLTVHMDDTNLNVSVWPRNIAQFEKGKE